jgi:hypothetical protein
MGNIGNIVAGINRALSFSKGITLESAQYSDRRPCIFLSHISEDKSSVIEIGKYIMEKGDIDIYLDIYDTQLQNSVKNNDPHGITEFIERGLKNSTHLMCLYSENTVHSWWVPYEIGYGKSSNAEVSSLKLKGDVKLPAYLQIGEVILGTRSLNKYIEKIAGSFKKAFGYTAICCENLIEHSASSHPLDNYLDWDK